MCPVCFATLGVLVGTVSSAGAGTVYLFKKNRRKKTVNHLDLTALERNEKDLPHTMSWVRHHERYESK